MKKINIIGVIIILISCYACQRNNEQSAQKKNVLFIAVDDLRLQAGVYGKNQMKTPSIDQLGAEGIVFDKAYCAVPVCGASRASLMSGLRPTPSRFVNYYTKKDNDAPKVPSIAKWFKEKGYTTLSRGKIYHFWKDDTLAWSDTPYIPQTGVGFQNYLTEESLSIVKANQTAEQPNRIKGPAFESPDVADNAYPDGLLTEQVVKDLKHFAENEEPFFLAVGFWKPHLPFNAPKKYWDLYDESDLKLADNPEMPEGAPAQAHHNWNELRGMYTGIPQEGPVSDELAKKLIHGYYACVSYTDAQIGMILKELKHLGLDENTVVVLWGDHGWHLGDHGLWCKHCHFDKVLNAPLIIKDPEIKSGKTSSLVEFIDIYPTLCELSGIEQPTHLDGKSLKNVMKDPSAVHKEAVFARYHNGESVRTDQYLYTQWLNDGKVVADMLYDHANDPDENINVSKDPAYSDVVKELAALLEENRNALNKQ
ncbi:sulfatase [Carboxylicivirga marina]|uniref:Sulfatase n=1 Tax=Carboxylicivirga marina TaxID=2800988 RepID=A0ABS1HEG8_9BACT|nr:sulfatase [Carboxylicivirga marina]MBK3516066.1 sulfatase [Carboxylicivirga marina]